MRAKQQQLGYELRREGSQEVKCVQYGEHVCVQCGELRFTVRLPDIPSDLAYVHHAGRHFVTLCGRALCFA